MEQKYVSGRMDLVEPYTVQDVVEYFELYLDLDATKILLFYEVKTKTGKECKPHFHFLITFETDKTIASLCTMIRKKFAKAFSQLTSEQYSFSNAVGHNRTLQLAHYYVTKWRQPYLIYGYTNDEIEEFYKESYIIRTQVLSNMVLSDDNRFDYIKSKLCIDDTYEYKLYDIMTVISDYYHENNKLQPTRSNMFVYAFSFIKRHFKEQTPEEQAVLKSTYDDAFFIMYQQFDDREYLVKKR